MPVICNSTYGLAVQVDLQELVRLKNLAGLERATTGQPGDWSLGTAVLPASEPAKVEPKRQICFDFTKHACTRGNACKFSHDINLIIEVNSQERGICFDFLRNTCSRGPLCRFSHDLSNFMPQDAQVCTPVCCTAFCGWAVPGWPHDQRLTTELHAAACLSADHL